jgi:hypothetical protein
MQIGEKGESWQGRELIENWHHCFKGGVDKGEEVRG